VLDEHERAARLALDALEQGSERLGLLLGDAGRRLVEEQHLRVVGDAHREVGHPAGAGGELADELVAEGAQVHQLDQVLHGPGHVLLDLALAGQAEERSKVVAHLQVAFDAQGQVLRHRQARHQPGVLEGAFISIFTEAIAFQTRRASLVAPILLGIVLIALLTQASKKGRAFSTGVSTWQAVKDIRGTPTELRRVKEVRLARGGLAVVGALFALAFPFVIGAEESGLAVELVVFAMVGVSLVILTGWSGQISLGQFAITGVGALVGGGLAANYNVDFFVVLVVAGGAGAVAALLIGLPALRIQGLLLAVTTLSFAFAVQEFVLQHEWFDFLKPESGRFVEPPILYGIVDLGSSSTVLGVDVRPDTKLYYLALVFLGLFCAAASSLRRSRTGRLLVGVRDNAKGVQAYGINVSQVRLFAFALSGFIAGVAGAIFAYQLGSVSDSVFTPDKSLLALTMVVIGGAATLPGAIIGALFVFGLPLMPVLKDVEQIRQLISGFGVLLVLLFLPGGLSELVYGWRDTFLRWVAAKHALHVPSLVADSLVTEGHDEFHGFETVSLGEEPPPQRPEALEEIELHADEEVPA